MDYTPYAWVFLALLCAFGQALGWAYKKKSLNLGAIGLEGRANCTLGVVAYLTAGILLIGMWAIKEQAVIPTIEEGFFLSLFIMVILNVIGVWAGFQAIDKEALSRLMPYIALTSIIMVPVEFVLRGVLPNFVQILGIGVVIVGAVLFADKKPNKKSLRAMKYFLVTLVCYSITSVYMAVLIDKTGSGLFSAAVTHFAIGLAFIPLVFVAKEHVHIKNVWENIKPMTLIRPMVIAGIIIALFENGPANLALEQADASEVFAIKRTMPFFILILDRFMFKEKSITKKHVFGTTLLVIGSAGVVFFKT